MMPRHWLVVGLIGQLNLCFGQVHYPNCVATNGCVDLRDGRYPSCESCGQYVECLHDTYNLTTCPPSTVYNIQFGQCGYIPTCNISRMIPAKTSNNTSTTSPMTSSTTHTGSNTTPSGSTSDFSITPSNTANPTTIVPATTSSANLRTTILSGALSIAPLSTTTSSAAATTSDGGSTSFTTPKGKPTSTTDASKTTAHHLTTPSSTAGIHRGSVTVRYQGIMFLKTATFSTGCIRTCADVPHGIYPSCIGCDHVLVCGNLGVQGKCVYGMVWDDRKTRCVRISSTCVEDFSYRPWLKFRYFK